MGDVDVLDQIQAAIQVVERLQAVPWLAHPAICCQPNRSELDAELAALRTYLGAARAYLGAEVESHGRRRR